MSRLKVLLIKMAEPLNPQTEKCQSKASSTNEDCKNHNDFMLTGEIRSKICAENATKGEKNAQMLRGNVRDCRADGVLFCAECSEKSRGALRFFSCGRLLLIYYLICRCTFDPRWTPRVNQLSLCLLGSSV